MSCASDKPQENSRRKKSIIFTQSGLGPRRSSDSPNVAKCANRYQPGFDMLVSLRCAVVHCSPHVSEIAVRLTLSAPRFLTFLIGVGFVPYCAGGLPGSVSTLFGCSSCSVCLVSNSSAFMKRNTPSGPIAMISLLEEVEVGIAFATKLGPPDCELGVNSM